MSSQDFLGELLKKSEADENVSVIIEMLLAIEDFQQVALSLHFGFELRVHTRYVFSCCSS